MTSNAKVRQKTIKPTIRQKVWNYMRRNRSFMISEVMAITGANYKNLREMFKVYELTGYVAVIKREKPFSATRLRLVKCTGVKAPSHDKERNTLFDYNIEEEIEIKAISSYEKVLNTLNKGMTTKEEIAKLTQLSEASLQKVYAQLKGQEILTRVIPTRRTSMGHRLFTVNLNKIETLISGISKGDIDVKELSQQKIPKKETVSKQVYQSEFLLKILSALIKEKMTICDISADASVDTCHVRQYLKHFVKHKIMTKTVPIEKNGREIIWTINVLKALEAKNNLLQGIRL